MPRTIRLEYPAVCADCGTKLHAGAEARYYGRGKVYGIACHPDRREPSVPRTRSGRRASGPRDEGHAPDLDRMLEDNAAAAMLYEYGPGEW